MIRNKRALLIILAIGGMVLPFGVLAQVEPPETPEEAGNFIMEILRKLPREIKRIWQEEVVPLWQKMWNWFLGLLGREVERVKPEIEEKVEETKQSLWQRFRALFR